MADIFIQALPKYTPDLIVLLGLYLLLLGRWKKQGRRRVLVYTVFSVYMLGVLWVTVLPVLSMLGIHHAYAPMNLEPFRDLRLGYGNAERQVFLNVLMTVPFGILWPVVRRGKAVFLRGRQERKAVPPGLRPRLREKFCRLRPQASATVLPTRVPPFRRLPTKQELSWTAWLPCCRPICARQARQDLLPLLPGE